MTPFQAGLIGYGEVGAILAKDLAAAGASVTAYDVRFDDPDDGLLASAVAARVACASLLPEAVQGRALVISAVTAAAAEEVSEQAAPHLDGALFVDLNSVSPETRRRCAAAVEAHGGRYVEAAVMAPIGPARIATPILLGGPHAAAAQPVLAELGFDVRVFSAQIGAASAVKMCRSVFVKGLEALVSESLLTARSYGVEEAVLSSLGNTVPHADWPALARYLITRTVVHGRRRSEEMREVVQTIRDAALPSWMSEGCVQRQAWAADLGIERSERLSLEQLLDRMLAQANRPSEPGRGSVS